MRMIAALSLILALFIGSWGLAQATPITADAPFIVTFPALTPAPAVDDPGGWGVFIRYFVDGPGTVQLTLFNSAGFLQNTPILIGGLQTFDVGSSGTGMGGIVANPLDDGVLAITVTGAGALDLASATLNFLSHNPATLNQVTTETLTFPTTHIASVPEPATIWPLALGLLGLATVVWRWRVRT